MTRSRDNSPEREIIRESKSSEKSHTTDFIKSGAKFMLSDAPNTLETKLHNLEEKNQKLSDIKRIKQYKKDGETQFYRARATMIEITALYEGKLYENPGDNEIKELAGHSSKFLDHLTTLDDIDINDPNNFSKAIGSYQEANMLANDTNHYTLEKKKIDEWKLDKTKTTMEIWQETIQQDSDRFDQYDYLKITNNTLKEAKKAFGLLKNKLELGMPERLIAQEIFMALRLYMTDIRKIKGTGQSVKYINDKKPTIPGNPIVHAMRHIHHGYNNAENGNFKSSIFEYYYKQFLEELKK